MTLVEGLLIVAAGIVVICILGEIVEGWLKK